MTSSLSLLLDLGCVHAVVIKFVSMVTLLLVNKLRWPLSINLLSDQSKLIFIQKGLYTSADKRGVVVWS